MTGVRHPWGVKRTTMHILIVYNTCGSFLRETRFERVGSVPGTSKGARGSILVKTKIAEGSETVCSVTNEQINIPQKSRTADQILGGQYSLSKVARLQW